MAIAHALTDTSGDLASAPATLTPTLPTGAGSSHRLIIVVATDQANNNALTLTPTNATRIGSQVSITNGTSTEVLLDVFHCAGNASPSFSNSVSGGAVQQGYVVAAFTGVDTTTPVDATGAGSTSASSQTCTVTGVTIATTNAWMLVAGADWLGSPVQSITGFTTSENGHSNAAAALHYNTTPKATGPTGSVTLSAANNAAEAIAALAFALRPAASSTVVCEDDPPPVALPWPSRPSPQPAADELSLPAFAFGLCDDDQPPAPPPANRGPVLAALLALTLGFGGDELPVQPAAVVAEEDAAAAVQPWPASPPRWAAYPDDEQLSFVVDDDAGPPLARPWAVPPVGQPPPDDPVIFALAFATPVEDDTAPASVRWPIPPPATPAWDDEALPVAVVPATLAEDDAAPAVAVWPARAAVPWPVDDELIARLGVDDEGGCGPAGRWPTGVTLPPAGDDEALPFVVEDPDPTPPVACWRWAAAASAVAADELLSFVVAEDDAAPPLPRWVVRPVVPPASAGEEWPTPPPPFWLDDDAPPPPWYRWAGWASPSATDDEVLAVTPGGGVCGTPALTPRVLGRPTANARVLGTPTCTPRVLGTPTAVEC